MIPLKGVKYQEVRLFVFFVFIKILIYKKSFYPHIGLESYDFDKDLKIFYGSHIIHNDVKILTIQFIFF